MTKSDGVRLHHKKERSGESSAREEDDGVRVHHEKERCGESLP